MTENWRPVPEYEGCYEVSDLGRVRSLGRPVNGRFGLWLHPRMLKPVASNGYLAVTLRKHGRSHKIRIHRLVLLAFVGDPPLGFEACHENRDGTDNRLANLRWDTPSGNSFDKVRHGTNVNQNSRRTHCDRNHPLTDPNIYRYGNRRVCKTCIAETARKRKGITAHAR